MKKTKFITFFIPVLIVMFLIFGVILFPQNSIEAGKKGLDIWVNILIPSLLPFIIGANLVVSLKIVDIIGFIINPITQLIFNVSGKGSLVFVISMISGYPVGAKLASELRNENQISQFEAQRLIAFCSTSGPLFIIGSVAVGMFKDSSLGYLMLVCHYLGAISVGLLFRNYGKETLQKTKSNLGTCVRTVINSKNENNEGFFVLFGNAVFSGVNTLLLIGGFVIIFSVVFEILSLFKVISLMSSILYIPLSFIGVSKELCQAFISGLFEMTIGCANISLVNSSSEVLKVSLSSFLVAFSGLSILAQCCTFIAKTDLSTNLYIFSKLLHGLFAGFFTFILYPLSTSTALVSNFSNIYDTFYGNSLWVSYVNNYKTILPLIVVFYLISALYTLNNSKSKKIARKV
ncbi:sporulation integral membrane protein YlbJ [Romboutsia weinsteinii]|uniref:Sporulation integral membrane protein YlbJ n=1 Tax=Romboutsia weinsteinii TaxID=2020949 RepID=A0A371J7D2_9FIRM|nr:sporulation integral membrane protein YlbJ [Romboutsia weinsteinii]RDY28690.1 sporulation integral membrane protein YlbJ [Romboutsia weinsteinii]